jgi:hypothetical protein
MYSNLRAHPKIILPPLKELRYFCRTSHSGNEGFIDRFITNNALNEQQHRDYLPRSLKRYCRNPARLFTQSKRLAWDGVICLRNTTIRSSEATPEEDAAISDLFLIVEFRYC